MLGRRAQRRRERREPVFDSHPEELLDLRLSADDRTASGRGGSHARRRDEPAFDDFHDEPRYSAYDDEPQGDARRRRKRAEPAFEVDDDPDFEDEPPPRRAAAKPARGGRSTPQRRKTASGGGNGRGGRGNGRSGRRRGGGRRGGGGRSWFRRLFNLAVALSLFGVVAVAGLLLYEGSKLPPIHTLEIPPRPPSITIVGTDGRVLAMRGEGSGGKVSLHDLPPYLPQAFVAIEDHRFYSHFGIDLIGLARAAVENLMAGSVVQGGSTLTQQLAKNLFLTPERSFERKIQEAILAVWLEHKLTKDQILEIYLNRVYFGSGAYGVEAASERYFNKPASHVTLAEAAILAGLVKAPTRLAPTRNAQAAEARGQVVLAAMADAGFITEADAARAMGVPLAVAAPRTEGSIGYVADWVVDQLDDLIGTVSQDIVVSTTIDPELQAEAEQSVVENLDKSGTKYGVGQAAMVSLTPQGAVRALVGGKSYAQSQFNRAVSAKRQPGSSFKPFVYLTAIENGYTPQSKIDDAPIYLKGWHPENYDHKYRGPVTLTEGLAKSLNTVAVRLALDVGPANVVATAHRMGITSNLDPNPSIALGTSAVSPLEMAGAYAPFSNGGYGVLPYVVREVRTRDGQVLYSRQGSGLGQVMTPEALAMMNSMMGEAVRIGTAKHAEVPGWQSAGKTGTSQDFRDAWFCGFTAHLVTVVWVGNDDNSPTKHASGSNLPVQIWSQYMTAAHRGVPVASLPGVNAPTLAADASPSRGNNRGLWSGGQQVRDLPEPLRAPIRFLKGLFGG